MCVRVCVEEREREREREIGVGEREREREREREVLNGVKDEMLSKINVSNPI